MAAYEENMNPWPTIRAIVSVPFIVAIVWAGIADWPDCAIWQLVLCGNAYWLWEMLILFVGWHGVLLWIAYVEKKIEKV